MAFWLVKTEPGVYSYDDLVRDKKTFWDGVRNYQARNNLKAMKKGDRVLIYHSVKERQVVGIAEVKKEHYPDPTAKDGDWVVVDLSPREKFKRPVTLETIKSMASLLQTALIRQSRLSVMPLTGEEYNTIVTLSGK